SSALGYAVWTSLGNVETVTMTARNYLQMETAANLLRSSLRVVDGKLAAPMGSDINSITGLPDWLSANRTTPWGAPYAYCPYAPGSLSGGSAATIKLGDGNNGYAVGTQEWPT